MFWKQVSGAVRKRLTHQYSGNESNLLGPIDFPKRGKKSLKMDNASTLTYLLILGLQNLEMINFHENLEVTVVKKHLNDMGVSAQ